MKRTYESPKFGFEELTLTEKIADVCWGTAGDSTSHKGWYDADDDGVFDNNEKEFTVTGSSCNEVYVKLDGELNAILRELAKSQGIKEEQFIKQQIGENVSDSSKIFIPGIHS